MGRPTTIAAALRSGLEDIASSFPLHRYLFGMKRYREDRRDVDHINGNGLDNRRANLRICPASVIETTTVSSRALNLANSGSRRGSSRFKGVSRCKHTGRWKAQITVDGHNRNLGRYLTEEEAALVYNKAAKEAWGENAQLNDITPES